MENLMVRTQIYLTEEERLALQSLATQSGKTQSELIREAVDSYIASYSQDRRDHIIVKVAGIWKERDDLPDFQKLRKNWDRETN